MNSKEWFFKWVDQKFWVWPASIYTTYIYSTVFTLKYCINCCSGRHQAWHGSSQGSWSIKYACHRCAPSGPSPDLRFPHLPRLHISVVANLRIFTNETVVSPSISCADCKLSCHRYRNEAKRSFDNSGVCDIEKKWSCFILNSSMSTRSECTVVSWKLWEHLYEKNWISPESNQNGLS
jgi:hypothetical protein